MPVTIWNGCKPWSGCPRCRPTRPGRRTCAPLPSWSPPNCATPAWPASRSPPPAGTRWCWPRGGTPAGLRRPCLFYLHYDVQPEGDPALWSAPPYAAVIRGDALIGRGAADDKGPILMLCAALRGLAECGAGLPVNVVVLVDGEEESGSPSLPAFLAGRAADLTADLVAISDTSMLGLDRPFAGPRHPRQRWPGGRAPDPGLRRAFGEVRRRRGQRRDPAGRARRGAARRGRPGGRARLLRPGPGGGRAGPGRAGRVRIRPSRSGCARSGPAARRGSGSSACTAGSGPGPAWTSSAPGPVTPGRG